MAYPYESELLPSPSANNDLQSATALTSGNTIKGKLSTQGDVDYFSIQGTSSSLLLLDFSTFSTSATPYWKISFVDSVNFVVPGKTITTGSSASLSLEANNTFTYYVKVEKADLPSSGDYYLTVNSVSTVEQDSEGNSTAQEALVSGNRLFQATTMSGGLTNSYDRDVWLFTPVTTGLLSLTFTPASTESGAVVTMSAVGSGKVVDVSKPFNAIQNTTYAVTVAYPEDTVATANLAYTLKVDGAAIDFNDKPVVAVDSARTTPADGFDDLVVSDVERNIQAGDYVVLNKFFTASDADSGQELSYTVYLSKPDGSTSNGYITVGVVSYIPTAAEPVELQLSAAEMQIAKFYAGTSTNPNTDTLTFSIQAHDNAHALDGTSDSAFIEQTFVTVPKLVTIVQSAASTELIEGSTSTKDEVTISLNYAFISGEEVTVYLQRGQESAAESYQLVFTEKGKTAPIADGDEGLIFTATGETGSKTIVVTAKEDSAYEAIQQGELSFRVVSNKSTSLYNDVTINPLVYTVKDTNNAPTGSVTLLTTDNTFKQKNVITASSDTFEDTDGIQAGSLKYEWQASSKNDDEKSWSVIDGAGDSNIYEPTNSVVGSYIRAVAVYTDGNGKEERVASAASTDKVANVNDAPTVNAVLLPDQSLTAGSSFSYVIPSNAFNDVDPLTDGGTLTYSATLADGPSLPTWLKFEGQTFTNTAQQMVAGTITVKVTATDNHSTDSKSVSDEFTITVTENPKAPKVAKLLDNQNATQGALFSFAVPANSFTDKGADGVTDASTTLTYTATQANGSPLNLTWLTFDDKTKTFSGTPTNGDVGTLSVKVTASDDTYSASDIFEIAVANVNDAPTFTPPNVLIRDTPATDTQASLYEGAINRTGTFVGSDSDGDALTYAIDKVTGIEGVYTLKGTYTKLTVKENGEYAVVVEPAQVSLINQLGFDATDTYQVTVSDKNTETVKTLTVNIAGDDDSNINDNPRLTTINTLSGARVNQPFEITYETLLQQADEADREVDAGGAGQTLRFSIASITAGVQLQHVAADGTTTKQATSNTTLSAREKLVWTPTTATEANSPFNLFTVKAVDSAGGVSDEAVSVKVDVGAVNQAPTSSGAITNIEANEAGGLQLGHDASGAANALMANITDVDSTQFTLTQAKENSVGSFDTITTGSLSVAGKYGTLAVSADGSYAYTVNQQDATVNAMGEDDLLTDAFTVKVSDGSGGTVDQVLHVEIDGTDDVAAGFDLSGTVQFWNGASPMSGVELDIPGISGKATTNTSGAFSHPALAQGTDKLNFTKTISSENFADDVISSVDARLALKISVGLSPNTDDSPASKYQFMAADVTGDGIVSSVDARNILKMSVGINDDNVPVKEWFFVAKQFLDALPQFDSDHVPVRSDINPSLLNNLANVEIIGIALGDINGNWTA